MKKVLLSTIVAMMVCLVTSNELVAQNKEQIFSLFRILKTNGERIEGKKGVLTPIGLEGISKAGTQLSIPRNEIRVLDRYAGSQAGKGAAIGVGLGATVALSVMLRASSDDTHVDEGGLVAGFTLGGGLIGLAVGAAYPKWEQVPLKTALQIRPQRNGGMVRVEFPF